MKEYQTRVASTCKKMAAAGIDVLLVTQPQNIYYLSGYRSVGHGIAPLQALIVTKDGDLKILSRMLEQQTVLNYTWTKNPTFYSDFEDPYKSLKVTLDEMKLSRKGFGVEMNSAYMSARRFQKVQQVFPKASFKNASGLIEDLRIVKSEEEIQCMRKAGKLTGIGIKAGIDATRVGVHEYEVAAEILHALYKNGQDDLLSSYYTINSGPTGGCAHDSYRDRVIQNDDLVIIELGGCNNLYTTNAIATIYIGTPSEAVKEIHKVTVKLHNDCIRACRRGSPAEDVWKVADKIYNTAGLGRYYRRVGFSVGISAQPYYWIGEDFDLVKGERRKLKAGMTLSVEPGAGSFGIGAGKEKPVGTLVGSNVLVTENEPEQLSSPWLELYTK
jgi:Xaa-Pro dipeptidase